MGEADMGTLTDTTVRNSKDPGRYGDGDGLYLVVAPSGSKSWVVRVQKDGRRRDIGLGGYPKASLKLARERAREVRSQVEAGADPVAERKRAAGVPTFRLAAAKVHTEHARGWRNSKHGAQWISTLATYAFPTIGELGTDKVDPGHVRDLLAPIWLEKPETAKRVLQRVATVLDWGFSKGWRAAELPRRSILKGLPKQGRKVVHHKAMPFDDVPAFLVRLREREGVSRLALEALILTAVRSGMVRGAVWEELDLDRALWTIPAERMKKGVEHIVPLSPAAVDAFRRALVYRRPADPARPDLVFPGMIRGKALSDMALTKLLRDMGLDVTAHGFRSSFRDWTAERTNIPNEVAEMALAHTIASKSEAAYRRGNLLDKRRQLMDRWAQFCTGEAGKVVRLVA